MTYEVRGGARRSSRRPILAVSTFAVLTVLAGVAGRDAGQSPPPRASTMAPEAATAGSLRTAPSVSPSGIVSIAASRIRCGGLDAWTCDHAIRAAADVIGEPTAGTVTADVYGSLVCGDDLDCPRSFLAAAEPVGSVVFTFGDGGRAWVNIVWIQATTRFEDNTGRFAARIVRWFPGGG